MRIPRSCEPIAENPPTSYWLPVTSPVFAGGTVGGTSRGGSVAAASAPLGLNGVTFLIETGPPTATSRHCTPICE